MKRTEEKTGLERAENTNHVLVDVGIVSGAVTGALVGIVGGAPGMIAGGVIGAAVGTVAGAVLDHESHRMEQVDRDLDAVIGVTDGDLGAKEAARASFTKKEEMAEAHRCALEAELEERTDPG